MKCRLCNETRISDEDLADHFLEKHFVETARKFFDMYSYSMGSEVVNAMSDEYDEDILCYECDDEEVENEGDACEDCEEEDEEEEDDS